MKFLCSTCDTYYIIGIFVRHLANGSKMGIGQGLNKAFVNFNLMVQKEN